MTLKELELFFRFGNESGGLGTVSRFRNDLAKGFEGLGKEFRFGKELGKSLDDLETSFDVGRIGGGM